MLDCKARLSCDDPRTIVRDIEGGVLGANEGVNQHDDAETDEQHRHANHRVDPRNELVRRRSKNEGKSQAMRETKIRN